jgi:hypothetical protein
MDAITQRRWIIGFIVYYLGTTAAQWSAKWGIPWLGLLVILGIVGGHLIVFPRFRGRKIQLILAVTVIAFIMETVLIAIGLYTVAPSTRWLLATPLCPIWIIALWLNFAIVLPYLLPFFGGRYKRAAIAGVIYALVVFYRAASLEILSFNFGYLGEAILVILWAIWPAKFFRLG